MRYLRNWVATKEKFFKVPHLKVPNFQENKLLMNKRKIAYFRGVGIPYCQNLRLSGHPETNLFINIGPFLSSNTIVGVPLI
jgi:hypothetical protein